MFGRLLNLTSNVKSLDVNQIGVSVFIRPDIKQFILRLNRVEQLYEQGLDVNDRIIGVYSYTTAKLAGEESYIFNGLVSVKRAGEPYTLFDTGEFYESFQVNIIKGGFTISANTLKPDGQDLIRFGEILGLTQQSKNELSEAMLPYIIESAREALLK